MKRACAVVVGLLVVGTAASAGAAPFQLLTGRAEFSDTYLLRTLDGESRTLAVPEVIGVSNSPGQPETIFPQFLVALRFDSAGALMQLGIGSMSLPLSEYLSDPLFATSAPITIENQLGVFKMPGLFATSVSLDATLSGSAQFGPGEFAMATWPGGASCPPADLCELGATFTSATLQFQNGVPTNFFGDAIFDGTLSSPSGLYVPTGGPEAGSFAYAFGRYSVLGPAANGDANYYLAASGSLLVEQTPDPTPVPEPATLSLIGLGIAVSAVRKLRRRGAQA